MVGVVEAAGVVSDEQPQLTTETMATTAINEKNRDIGVSLFASVIGREGLVEPISETLLVAPLALGLVLTEIYGLGWVLATARSKKRRFFETDNGYNRVRGHIRPFKDTSDNWQLAKTVRDIRLDRTGHFLLARATPRAATSSCIQGSICYFLGFQNRITIQPTFIILERYLCLRCL